MTLVRLAADAKRDLREIWKYIAQDNPAAADRIIDGLTSRFDLLARFPGIGQARDDLRSGMRSFPVGNYVIYFLPQPNALRILRVVHGARDAGQLF